MKNEKIETVIRMRHIGIVVSNLSKAMNIFSNLFNLKLKMKPIMNEGKYINTLVGLKNVKSKVCIFELPDKSRLELLEYMSPKGKKRSNKSNEIGVSHFAITINNMDKFLKKSKKFNVQFVNKPILSEDKFVKVAYVKVLNEILIEIVEVLNKRADFSGGK